MNISPLFLVSLLVIGTNPIFAKECHKEERDALLSFKGGISDPSNLLSSWHGDDCCNWWGVLCDNSTGYVMHLDLSNQYNSYWAIELSNSISSPYAFTGEINQSLLGLKHLTYFDLSMNDFSTTTIPEFIGSFENLQYLNLSYSSFTGEIPPQLGNLSNLLYLDLSNLEFIGKIPPQLGNLSKLLYLDLSNSNLTGKIPPQLENLSKLLHLDLSNSKFTEKIPPELGNISNLIFLNLGRSYGFDVKDHVGQLSWISQLSSLRYLDMTELLINNSIDWLEINKLKKLETLILESCFWGGSIPSYLSFENLTSLKTLDLSLNLLYGNLPSWLWNLTTLVHLDLSWNPLNGTVHDALSNLILLEYLNLERCEFDPIFPEAVQQLCNLRSIHLGGLGIESDMAKLIKKLGCTWYNLEEVNLSRNKLHGNLSIWIEQMTSLIYLDLSSNSLSGSIPQEIVKLSKLTVLDLSTNQFSGFITEAHLASLFNLKELYLSQNSITISLNDKWIPPFQLRSLVASSCVLNSFPRWIQRQTQLLNLILSNSSMSGTIPNWFWNLSVLQIVDLSENNITGRLPKSLKATMLFFLSIGSNCLEGSLPSSYPSGLYVLDLSNNFLSGNLPKATELESLSYLFLSRNSINGSLPSNFCNMKNLELLDISSNNISGELPNCSKKSWSTLEYIDLSNNNLVGQILDYIGSSEQLQSLQLGNNSLSGELPMAMQYCKNLKFLDLTMNNFWGNIPEWIGENFQYLIVLALRSNFFSGNIPSKLGQLEYLQILDLSRNNLWGPIPNSLGNLSTMKDTTGYYGVGFGIMGKFYQFDFSTSLYAEIKGQYLYYSKTLELVKLLDLSSNNLSGDIPEPIFSLLDIISINLSRNHLEGRISENIGEMQSLESLDFSFNKLDGPIPESLSKLTALSHLNLSYNNFFGKVPTGRQLDTLNDSSIYVGNLYLCGPPTERKCSDGEANNTNYDMNEDDHGFEMIWLLVSIATGFVGGFWCVCGALLLKRAWRVAFFQMVDHFFDNVYVKIVLTIRRLSKRFV